MSLKAILDAQSNTATSDEEAERWYFLVHPDEAVKEIARLRKIAIALANCLRESGRNEKRLLHTLSNTTTSFEGVLEEYRRLARNNARRMANINPTTATKKNKERADVAKRALQDFIRRRVRENPRIQNKQLAREILEGGWMRKGKKGNPYKEGYVLRLVGSARKQA